MKKTALALTLIIALLLSVVTSLQFLRLGRGNPYFTEYKPPDSDVKPPKISILEPINNTVFTWNISIRFTVNVGIVEAPRANFTYISAIYYEADWKEQNVSLSGYIDTLRHPEQTLLSFSENLDQIPDGNHVITVYAFGGGGYAPRDWTRELFFIDASSSIHFTVDTKPPKIEVLSPENKTYYTTNIPLNFTADEPLSEINYRLDGQEIVNIQANTTLTNLSIGQHFITIFAKDRYGHAGSSQTIVFTTANVPEVEPSEPFPTVPVAAVSGTSAFAAGAALLFYFKKRHN